MEKIDWLKYRGNVMKFDDFCKNRTNEALEMDIKSPDGVEIIAHQDDVMDAVGNLIEQVSGWDMEVFKKYVGEQMGKKRASHKDIIQWIMQEVNKYCHSQVTIKGEEYVKNNKRDALSSELKELDYYMIVERIYRRLRGLDEEDMPSPLYFKRMVEICKEYLVDKEKNEFEEEEEEEE